MSNEIEICLECRGTGAVFFQNADGEYDCEPCMSCIEEEEHEAIVKEYEGDDVCC